MERNLVTEQERFALARVGVRVTAPIRAPFFTDATSQYRTLRQKVNPAPVDTFNNQPGQVGLLLYIKSFPRASNPDRPSRDEIRDAVLAEMQNARVIHLDHSDNSRSGPVKVLGNRGASKLTSELSDLVSYIREIKKRLQELVGDVASHGPDIPDILSFVAAGCQQMNLITLREMLIGFPKDPRWTIDEAWATEERPWHNKGNVLVHSQSVARELVSLLSRRWWTLDRERPRIDHFATQIFTAKFGVSPKNMAGIVRQCYLEHPYRNEDPVVTQHGPDDFRYRMTECVRFIDAYQSWMAGTRHIWGSGRGNRNRGAPDERTITRTDIQSFDKIYDDFMDSLFNAAKLLQDDLHEADIEREIASCENHSRALHQRLVNHPQHLRLIADPSQSASDVTSPGQNGTRSQTGRTIPPIEREQIGLIQKWFDARWTDTPRVRPLAIYRTMLPPEENMGRRRKEPELVDRQQRVMTRAVVPQNNGPDPAGNARGNLRAPNGAATPQAGGRMVFNQGRGFPDRGRGRNSNTREASSGRSRGGNAWGGNPPTPQDTTDSSESEPSSSGDDNAQDGRESLRGQKRSRVFDPVEEVVVRTAKRHKTG